MENSTWNKQVADFFNWLKKSESRSEPSRDSELDPETETQATLRAKAESQTQLVKVRIKTGTSEPDSRSQSLRSEFRSEKWVSHVYSPLKKLQSWSQLRWIMEVETVVAPEHEAQCRNEGDVCLDKVPIQTQHVPCWGIAGLSYEQII